MLHGIECTNVVTCECDECKASRIYVAIYCMGLSGSDRIYPELLSLADTFRMRRYRVMWE